MGHLKEFLGGTVSAENLSRYPSQMNDELTLGEVGRVDAL